MAGHDVVIREATLVDADALGLIHKLSLQASVPFGVSPAALVLSASDRAAEWREWLKVRSNNQEGQAFVADSTHGSVGFICVVPELAGSFSGCWLVSHFSVLEAHQRQGIGERLFATALKMVACQCGVKMDILVPSGAPWCMAIEKLGGLLDRDEEVMQSGVTFSACRYSFSVFSE